MFEILNALCVQVQGIILCCSRRELYAQKINSFINSFFTTLWEFKRILALDTFLDLVCLYRIKSMRILRAEIAKYK